VKLIRVLRGVVGTALSFAVPWALAGGALAVGIELLWPSLPGELRTPASLWWFARTGGLMFGALGAVSGALFAAALAASGRRISFEQLNSGRMLALGALGGVTVSGMLFGAFVLTGGAWTVAYTIGMGITALLGGVTGPALLHIARRAPAHTSYVPLGSGTEGLVSAQGARE